MRCTASTVIGSEDVVVAEALAPPVLARFDGDGPSTSSPGSRGTSGQAVLRGECKAARSSGSRCGIRSSTATRHRAADYVELETGTGAVHTAPGHGEDDFETGVSYGLPIINPVDSGGRFTAEAGPYAGLQIFDANARIVDDLRASGALVRASRTIIATRTAGAARTR